MGTRMEVAGNPVRGRSVALLGRSNVVFLHFYAKESEWDRHAPVVEAMAAGFRRTPDQVVTMGSRTVTTGGKTVGRRGFDWGRVGSRALIGAGIGAAIGVFSWIAKRKNKPAK
jgi:hypothetical protein